MFVIAQVAGSELGPWVLGAGAIIAIVNGAVKLGDRLWQRQDEKEAASREAPAECKYQPCTMSASMEQSRRELQEELRTLASHVSQLTRNLDRLVAANEVEMRLNAERHSTVLQAVRDGTRRQ